MASPSSSFTILGAGLMGRLLAVSLAQAGHAVEIFDAHGPEADGAAARVAAAMLAPLAESAVTEPSVVRMGHYALARWPQIIAGLEQHVFFQQNGTLVLWHRQDAAEAARFAGVLAHTRQAVPELPAPRPLDAPALAQAEPTVAGRFAQGLYLPGEGQLDNRQLLAALLAAMERLGVRMHWHSPRALGAPCDQGRWLIDSRGLGARPEWGALRGIRGEVVRVHAPDVALARPTRLVHPRYPIYIAPKEDHLFVVGATEIESDDMSPASVRSALELLSALYAVHPGFAEARILEIATQCRPTLPDNLPAIRRLGPRTLQVNGLYRHGYMVSPAVLDATLELIATGASPLAERLALRVEAGAGQ
ncbi:FAD-dependent oxidoreductase [Ramlibacter sp. H39-3-26]|uniref:FAD-dependent oxidoreductase n=1 Tax=Curvibacter soli TaxID=3031331 RepID=UPI0023DC706E|nr:FAD-dependent oxidoreductase [Ramlibacter sp. H39-3-26]MDF1485687.1 FAD-dependent oxidoreductase [Ramlibacter sp. H39-3-26]